MTGRTGERVVPDARAQPAGAYVGKNLTPTPAITSLSSPTFIAGAVVASAPSFSSEVDWFASPARTDR